MRYIFLLLLIPAIALAAAEDIRISDNQGNVLNITSTGNLSISTTNTTGTDTAYKAPDIRISDNNGTVLNITSAQFLQIKTK